MMTKTKREREADPFYHEIMRSAWGSCMSWAIREPEIRERFRAETGMDYKPPKSGLDQMIDEATGYGNQYMEAFIVWATRNLWSAPDGVPPRIAALVTDWPEQEEETDTCPCS